MQSQNSHQLSVGRPARRRVHIYEKCPNYFPSIAGSVYQVFISANDIVDASDMPEDVKAEEKAKILEARKAAFGDSFRYYPPWKSR